MLALSQDGTQLTYVGASLRQLYLRALDSMGTRSLAGTEGATSTFFSQDGDAPYPRGVGQTTLLLSHLAPRQG